MYGLKPVPFNVTHSLSAGYFLCRHLVCGFFAHEKRPAFGGPFSLISILSGRAI